jgi:hypothetical protein
MPNGPDGTPLRSMERRTSTSSVWKRIVQHIAFIKDVVCGQNNLFEDPNMPINVSDIRYRATEQCRAKCNTDISSIHTIFSCVLVDSMEVLQTKVQERSLAQT